MKKKLQVMMAALVLSMGIGFTALAPVTYAADENTEAEAPCTGASQCIKDGLSATGGSSTAKKTDIKDIVQLVINVLLFIIAALSVIMIIVGGIRYVVSAGNQQAVTGAKNTIMYSVVGLLVSIFAYAIVNFIINQFVS